MSRPRAAIYCRLSDEDRNKKNPGDESESIQNQRSMLLEYCVRMGWDVYQIYCDEDYSGADQSRPEWLRMLRDCENGKIDIVLCKTQSRFSREIEITEKYISNKFPLWKVRFVATYDNIDTANEDNKKARQIGGLVNEWMLDDLSRNVRKTLEHKKKNGQWTGSFAPYGYKTDPRDHNKLLIDEAAAQVVKEIFKMYLDGHGYVTIAKSLNDRKILNPTLYKKSCGLKFRTNSMRPTSKIWTDSTIYRLLRNEMYIGTMVQGKRKKFDYRHASAAVPQHEWIRVPGTHEPVIDLDTWNTVQAKLAGNRTRQEKASGKKNVLAGKVYCSECGGSMWKMSCKQAYGTYQYYKCRTAKGSRTACTNNHGVRADYLDVLLKDSINELLSEFYEPDSISVSAYQSDTVDMSGILKAEKEKNTLDIRKKRSAIALLYEDMAEDRISRREGAHILSKYEEEIEHRETRNTAIDKELETFVPAFEPDVEDIIRGFSRISVLSIELVDELIDKISVGADINGARSVSIFWNV